MPLRDFKCTACDKEAEYYYSSSRTPQCSCGGELLSLPLSATIPKTSVFPFVTNHIDPDGRPITVDSIGHLRTLERTYGVVVSAFSNDPRHLDPTRDPPRYLGDDLKRERRRR